MLLSQFSIHFPSYSQRDATKVYFVYTSNILEIYFQIIFEVYFKYTSSILQVYFKYTSTCWITEEEV